MNNNKPQSNKQMNIRKACDNPHEKRSKYKKNNTVSKEKSNTSWNAKSNTYQENNLDIIQEAIKNNDTTDILEGRNPILEALKSNIEINKLFIQNGETTGSLKQIIAIAREKSILIKETDRTFLDKMSNTHAHQGVIAMISPIKYVPVDDILNKAKELGQDPFIVILDGICDPNNLGSILRTSDAVGVHGIIIPKHNATGITASVAKVSAGAYSHVPVCRVVNINNIIDHLKEKGLWVAGTDSSGAKAFYESNLTGSLAIVIGSEGKGMSKLTAKKCDFIINIPMSGKISSLNAGVASGIILYEAYRQRREGNSH